MVRLHQTHRMLLRESDVVLVTLAPSLFLNNFRNGVISTPYIGIESLIIEWWRLLRRDSTLILLGVVE